MEWLMTLQGYINAWNDQTKLNKKAATEREAIFSSLYPQYEVVNGIPNRYMGSTEKAALKLADLNNYLKKYTERNNRKKALLDEAMDQLNEVERKAFTRNILDSSKLMDPEAGSITEQAIQKVCSFIEDYHRDREEEVQKQHRQERREEIAAMNLKGMVKNGQT